MCAKTTKTDQIRLSRREREVIGLVAQVAAWVARQWTNGAAGAA